ncbi:UNVERIFIED_CONTAM: hypothetical protein K2H54_054169 [Gekko kuhli]
MERPVVEAGEGRASSGTLTMTGTTDKRGRATSPSWCLSRAGSSASMGQPERSASKALGTAPEFQLMLKHDMELIKAQLCAQTKAFEALSHSITLLEQESRQQRSRIAQLEEELKIATCSSRGTAVEAVLQARIQELWRAVAVEVQRLQASLSRKESSMENLSQEVLESKKILWEELEAVQAELQRIHQKLKQNFQAEALRRHATAALTVQLSFRAPEEGESQDVDITRNLVSIKKMRENQVGCIRFLAQLKNRVSGEAAEKVDREPGNEDAWSSVSSDSARSSPLSSSNTGSDKRGPLREKSVGQSIWQRRRN